MIRMIDATELKTAFPPGEYVRTECVRTTIDHMQTIDAIPVEWLRSQLKNNLNDIESAYDDICINEFIDRWQKGQEAR